MMKGSPKRRLSRFFKETRRESRGVPSGRMDLRLHDILDASGFEYLTAPSEFYRSGGFQSFYRWDSQEIRSQRLPKILEQWADHSGRVASDGITCDIPADKKPPAPMI